MCVGLGAWGLPRTCPSARWPLGPQAWRRTGPGPGGGTDHSHPGSGRAADGQMGPGEALGGVARGHTCLRGRAGGVPSSPCPSQGRAEQAFPKVLAGARRFTGSGGPGAGDPPPRGACCKGRGQAQSVALGALAVGRNPQGGLGVPGCDLGPQRLGRRPRCAQCPWGLLAHGWPTHSPGTALPHLLILAVDPGLWPGPAGR